MKSLTTLSNLYNSLSNNTSTANTSLGKQLINDQHRYLLQKYFDNERTATTTTIGGASLTLTGSLALAATTGTLTVAWAYPTSTQLVNFSNSNQREVLFTYNSTAISWADGLTATATTAISTVGVQGYQIPANISKVKNLTINVGQLRYQPREIMTRQEWDLVNFLPYTSDIPQYYFVYNNKINIFPIPSTTGNIINYNYKVRVADLSYADYSSGNIAAAGATIGSVTVTGTTTNWITTGTFPSGVDLTFQNLNLRIDPPFGDGIWYPIRSFTSGTVLVLVDPVINAPNITGSTTYTIGQFPLLNEDFHDMLVHGALMVYFSSITPDTNKFEQFKALYDSRLELLAEYAGTKAVDVDLGDDPQAINPNLFLYAN